MSDTKQVKISVGISIGDDEITDDVSVLLEEDLFHEGMKAVVTQEVSRRLGRAWDWKQNQLMSEKKFQSDVCKRVPEDDASERLERQMQELNIRRSIDEHAKTLRETNQVSDEEALDEAIQKQLRSPPIQRSFGQAVQRAAEDADFDEVE